MGDKLPISVVIPTKNEIKNLPGCLHRLTRFDDIAIVDSGSTDGTLDVARQAGIPVHHFEWNGRYPKKRNWYLLNFQPKYDWVLFLDADEFVTDAFCDEAARQVASTNAAGFWLNYSNYFLGDRLRFGIPQRKLALFRRDAGLYERIDEADWSGLDMEIHEHPVIKGSISEIRAPIDHRDFAGIEKFLRRHQDYARWEARRIQKLKSNDGDAPALTKRQRFKYKHIEKWWYPAFYFLYQYIVRLGILDGSAGFQYAFYKAWYFLSIRLICRELASTEAKPAPKPVEQPTS
ncbi:MAG: glycosyltransferase family 2 protein [Pseudomonadota bacterium]